MKRIQEKYRYHVTPQCNPKAVVQGANYRFTVLNRSLVRMEYSPEGQFEDRATQIVVNREFDVPAFWVSDKDGCLVIRTECLEITYTGGAFSRNSLSAKFAGELGGNAYVWYYGDKQNDLGGTARTLDGVNGACKLEGGMLSRRGMEVLDDSKSLVLAEDGWVDVRDTNETDIYLFAHRTRYAEALQDYYKLTGSTPLLPRYALGNWWSRFYRYTQEEYQELMKEFKREKIPFSVAVIDMDWHKTRIAPKYGSGWTGFSWNEELFPNPKEFLEFLHKEGMEVTLNLHPAEGVAAHEDCYAEVAKAMGMDVQAEEKVPFDITNPKWMETYFEKILHPMEEEGVSFWWMDWQQGTTTKVPGLDPLWMLNHYHYVDMQDKNQRPLIFSRYAGPGSHRYPVGFSGDTIVTWESLDFQPYFTANASNIGYGWWSHDIGGHMGGVRDDEMYARWVQLGAFSPILRLHSSNSPFQSKEPWNYGKEAGDSAIRFLKLRHHLIPYLYTMNFRAHEEGMPLVQPLYYAEPYENAAYEYNRNEYFFGSEMFVAPITEKADAVTGRGCAKVYFPKGLWFDFFHSRSYRGGRCLKVYRSLDTMPVFVKAGGMIPMAEPEQVNDISNPKKLRIMVFPGADNTFELYEDDGITMDYQKGVYAKTRICYRWGSKPELVIHRPAGDETVMVKDRDYEVVFRNITPCSSMCVTEDGKEIPFEVSYEEDCLCVKVTGINGTVQILFGEDVEIAETDYKQEIFDLLHHAQWGNMEKMSIYRLMEGTLEKEEFVSGLMAMDMEMDQSLLGAVLESVFRN